MTNFEKVTASPEALGEFLAALPVATGPWDECFHRIFCDSCAAENCDAGNCPHNAERDNPLWWLKLEAEPGDGPNRIVMWVKEYRKTMEELAGKIKEARSERVKATGDKSFTHLEALLSGLVEVLLPAKKCRVVMDYDPDAEEAIFSQLSARDIQVGRSENMELTGKGNDILNKAEDVILRGVEKLGETQEKMTGEDCRSLQTLVCTAERIQAIRHGSLHSNYPE